MLLEINGTPEFWADFVAFQSEITNPPKTREVKMRGTSRAGREYEVAYSYTELSALFDQYRPLLAKYGFLLTQLPSTFEGKTYLVTILGHKSGGYLKGSIELPKCDNAQDLGKWWTYLRRYSFASIIGVASEEDTDGDVSEPQKPKPTPQKPKVENGSNGSMVQAPRSGSNGNGISSDLPRCLVCNAGMLLSKAKTGYYCPNFRDGKGEHSRFKTSDLEMYLKDQEAHDQLEKPGDL
jgi:ERF superfamily